MFIHFAFSGLKDNIDVQIHALLDHILNEKRLKYGINPEFIPVFRQHIHPKFTDKKVVDITLESFKETSNGAMVNLTNLKTLKYKSDIHYLRQDVKMICFTKIAFNKLENYPHSQTYGKLGIVLNENFLRKKEITPVQYYSEESLFKDSLINKWNLDFAYKPNLSQEELRYKKDLEIQILAFRKPSKLFKTFSESRRLAIEKTEFGVDIRIEDAYERYPIGYNFQNEIEWRIVSLDEEYLEFSEDNLDLVMVPNEQSKFILLKYFESEWNKAPEVHIFPGS